MKSSHHRAFFHVLLCFGLIFCLSHRVDAGQKKSRSRKNAAKRQDKRASEKKEGQPVASPSNQESVRTPEELRQLNFRELDLAQFSGIPIPSDPDLRLLYPRKKRFDGPAEAARYYLQKRLPEGETELPVDRYFEAQEQMGRMPQFSSLLDRQWNSQTELRNEMRGAPEQQKLGTWSSLGPGNIGGRTRAMLVHPQNPSIFYAAGVAGGVWKSTNAGASWTPISDLIANIAVVSLAFDPKNPNVIYAGTGEGFLNSDGVRGAGIFKTTDAGQTWKRLESTTTSSFYYVHDLVVSPNESMRVYAGTANGVWRSLDGGETWTPVLPTTLTVGCTDLAIRTDKTTDYLYSACGSFVQATIYRNTDAAGTGTWDAVLSESGMGRTAIAIAPSNQNIVYAVTTEYRSSLYTHALYAFFRSTSSGDSGSWVARVRNSESGNKLGRSILSVPPQAAGTDCKYATSDNFSGQSWYNLTIAVDPVDENRVWVGGVDLFRSDDGGVNWGLAGFSYVGANFGLGPTHPDQHVILFHPQYNGTTNQQMFVGNDGGVFRTDNARAAIATGPAAHCNQQVSQVQWTNINNNYGVTQFYHGTVHPDGRSYFGGTQDNGTVRGTDGDGPNSWKMIFGADGAYGAINFLNPNILYTSTQNRGIRKSSDGGETFSSAITGLTGGGLFITPIAMDPSDPRRLYTSGTSIFRTNNGATSWSQLTSTISSSGVTAIAVAPTDANYAIFGGADGSIVLSTRILNYPAGILPQSPFENSLRPRVGVVSWVTFDPTNKNIAYATYSTFNSQTAVGHVFRTIDAGVTWTNIDGTGDAKIPDIPVHCIVVDPANTSRLYVGTDTGVFVSLDGGATWSVENSGFANVVTESLQINVVNGVTTLYAFTHGRGAYKVILNNNGCNYSLSQTGTAVSAAGGDATVNVTIAPGGCSWTAQSNVPWITLQTGTGGTANGSVSMKIAENKALTRRAGTVAIAGRSFTVTQDGLPDLDPPSVAITTPSASVVETPQPSIALSGTVLDNSEVSSVSIRTDRGVTLNTNLNSTRTIWTSSGNVPLATGANLVTVTAMDTTGKTSTATIRVISKPSSVLVTAVGSGVAGFNGDNISALAAGFSEPWRFTYDSAGNLYVADDTGHRIRKISPSGIITTVAGTGVGGFEGDGGPATAAKLNLPSQVAVDKDGNLYIADFSNNRVRKVTAATGIITTFAGNGASASMGDGGLATEASLNRVESVAIGKDGNLYITDVAGHKIRKVTMSDGKISTVVGTGTNGFSGDGGAAVMAAISTPVDIAFDGAGDMYIAAAGNNRIRKVSASDGMITTVAGSGSSAFGGDGGPATAAGLNGPYGVAVDGAGNLYIADRGNNRIRFVRASDKTIDTLAGGTLGFSPDGSGAIGARLGNPVGVGLDPAGKLYFSEPSNVRLRTLLASTAGDVTPPVVTVSTPAANGVFATTTSPLALTGTASDAGGIAVVRWANDRGGSGQAAGSSSWSVPAVSLQPGTNILTITAWDSSGNASSAQLTVNYTAQQILLSIAGTTLTGLGAGDGGPGIAADLSTPTGIAVDSAGNLYIADSLNRRIRKVDTTGKITAFAGTGELGSGGDGGAAVDATMNTPVGIVIDARGNLFFSDSAASKVRKVGTDGKISTVAGSGQNFGDYSGDNGPAVAAKLNGPQGLAVDAAGNLYIADRVNNRIRKVTASTGVITTVAGNGQLGFTGDGGLATQASFVFPTGVAVDSAGNLYIADQGNHRIRRVSVADGKIATIAGTGAPGFNGDGILAKDAQINLSTPTTPSTALLFIDPMGNLIFADRGNHRIRKINLTDGTISTLAGTGTPGFGGDGGIATGALLQLPQAVVLDAAGNLYISDSGNNRVRRTFATNALKAIASVSAASFAQNAELAPESIAAGFSASLASSIQSGTNIPLPTTLAGMTMKLRDNLGAERPVPLFFVSPQQVNFQVPNGTTNGIATLIATTDRGDVLTGTVNISAVAPGIFTANANGQGVLAAVALRVKADNSFSYEPILRLDSSTNRFVSLPIDLGPDTDKVFLVGFGTGLRFRTSLANVTAAIGGINSSVQFAGPVPGLVGLDQFNIELGRNLAGKGEVDLILTVDGKAANVVKISIK